MSDADRKGEPLWTMLRRIQLRSWLVALLLGALTLMEWQRLDAMAKAHRERQDLAIQVAELGRKVDWLLLVAPPTPSALALRPPVASGLAR